MNVFAMLAIFIAWPFLALVPAVAFTLAFLRCRRAVVLIAALAWLAYCPYEYAMKLRILCSGECNIRVDLLLFYPVLLILSVLAAYAFIRFLRAPKGA